VLLAQSHLNLNCQLSIAVYDVYQLYNLAHVFHDYNLAFILIIAILELWLIEH